MHPRILTSILTVFASGAAFGADALSYQLKPDQVAAYRFKITVDSSSEIETMTGVIQFTGKQAAEDTFTILHTGGLKKTTKAKGSRRPGPPGRGGFGGSRGPRGFGGPPMSRGPFAKQTFEGFNPNNKTTITMTRSGKVTSMRGESQLPYLLGNLAVMPFESLPQQNGQTKWSTGSGVTITSQSENSGFRPRLPFEQEDDKEVKGGGGEKSEYQIVSDKDGLVSIRKTYSLSSPKAAKDETGFKVTGSGTWVFNRTVGLSESMDQKLSMVISEDNAEVTFPITMQWTRLSEQEYTKHKDDIAKKQAELKERLAKQKANQKPATPKAINKYRKQGIMRQLQNRIAGAISGQLFALNNIGPKPVVKEDMDMLTLIGKLQGHKDAKVSASAKTLWNKWKDTFYELATDEQKAEVAKVTGETIPASTASTTELADSATADPKMADTDNPFEDVVEDDGTGVRTWTDSTGKFKIVGTFVEVKGTLVMIKKEDGKLSRLPKSRLSKEDQKIVDKLTSK